MPKLKKFWMGYYYTDDGRWVPIRSVASMYPARVKEHRKPSVLLRGATQEAIDNRLWYRKKVDADPTTDEHWVADQYKMLDIFARECGARLDGTSK